MIECNIKIQLESFMLDANFSIPDRGITVVFGPSGSGKTTLLRAIAGLEKSDDGFLKIGDSVWQKGEIFCQYINARLDMSSKMLHYLITLTLRVTSIL